MRLRCPRFSIRTILLATTLVAVATPMLLMWAKSWLSEDGVVIYGDASEPNDTEIRQAMREHEYTIQSESVEVHLFQIADYRDRPTRIPFLGAFQRFHKHFECNLLRERRPDSLPKVYVKRSEMRWLK